MILLNVTMKIMKSRWTKSVEVLGLIEIRTFKPLQPKQRAFRKARSEKETLRKNRAENCHLQTQNNQSKISQFSQEFYEIHQNY